jgi:tRNA dimethylallyltransferase
VLSFGKGGTGGNIFSLLQRKGFPPRAKLYILNIYMKQKIIQVVGPTASGKTAFSVELAKLCGAEIVNVDSMQVYKDLAVGSDKPSAAERETVRFFGLDLIELGPPMDAARFADYADACIADIAQRGKIPMLSGGTGLYHRCIVRGILDAPSRDDAWRAALRAERDIVGQDAIYARLENIDPDLAANIMPSDWVRIERGLEYYALTGKLLSVAQKEHGFMQPRYDVLSFGVWRPREERYEKINSRLDEMWKSGLLEETQILLDAKLDLEELPLKALGYKQAACYLLGNCSRDEALERAKQETRRFAKRQMTWFRSDKAVHWLRMPLDGGQFETLATQVQKFMAGEDFDLSILPIWVDA